MDKPEENAQYWKRQCEYISRMLERMTDKRDWLVEDVERMEGQIDDLIWKVGAAEHFKRELHATKRGMDIAQKRTAQLEDALAEQNMLVTRLRERVSSVQEEARYQQAWRQELDRINNSIRAENHKLEETVAALQAQVDIADSQRRRKLSEAASSIPDHLAAHSTSPPISPPTQGAALDTFGLSESRTLTAASTPLSSSPPQSTPRPRGLTLEQELAPFDHPFGSPIRSASCEVSILHDSAADLPVSPDPCSDQKQQASQRGRGPDQGQRLSKERFSTVIQRSDEYMAAVRRLQHYNSSRGP